MFHKPLRNIAFVIEVFLRFENQTQYEPSNECSLKSNIPKEFTIHLFGLILWYNILKDSHSLHSKQSFSLRISSVNMTKSTEFCDLVTLTGKILNVNFNFL